MRRKQSLGRPFCAPHREVIAAMDFFTVPTLSFRVLYCFFVIEHGRRQILHFHTTAHPTSEWIVQQLREAFPFPSSYRYVILDRDAKFGHEVLQFLQSSGLEPIRTSIPEWPSVGWAVFGAKCSDHAIPLHEFHLRRLVRDYLAYYHEDRTHDGLGKQTPANDFRPSRPDLSSRVVGLPRLGGLHHRYEWSRVV